MILEYDASATYISRKNYKSTKELLSQDTELL